MRRASGEKWKRSVSISPETVKSSLQRIFVRTASTGAGAGASTATASAARVRAHARTRTRCPKPLSDGDALSWRRNGRSWVAQRRFSELQRG